MAKQEAAPQAVEQPKLNIYQKLLEIQKRVIGLGKDKKSFGYDYVTGAKVLEHIKPLMNEYGLLLKQEVLDFDNTRIDHVVKSGPKSEILSSLKMKFTWVDVETGEKDENLFGANGQNDFEKGFGSALTYAERYFLLKFFHIATDEDDIDNPDRKPEDKKPAETPKRLDTAPLVSKPVTAPKTSTLPSEPAKTGTAAAALKPNESFEGKPEEATTVAPPVDERRKGAKAAFAKLDQPTVLRFLVKEKGIKTFASVTDWIDNTSIDDVLVVYNEVKALK